MPSPGIVSTASWGHTRKDSAQRETPGFGPMPAVYSYAYASLLGLSPRSLGTGMPPQTETPGPKASIVRVAYVDATARAAGGRNVGPPSCRSQAGTARTETWSEDNGAVQHDIQVRRFCSRHLSPTRLGPHSRQRQCLACLHGRRPMKAVRYMAPGAA